MIEIEIKNGLGDFDIIGTKDCTIFEYKHRSKILVWEMNWNSLMNFFVGRIAKKPILYMKYFLELQSSLQEGLINQSNLKERFKPLLNNFGNAKYKLEIIEIKDSYHIIKTGVSTDFYPNTNEHKLSKVLWAGGYPFIYAIQEEIDEKTVEYYENQIRNGTRPQVVFIKGNNSKVQLILDGHHKLEAYNKTKGINPVCIQITKMTNYRVANETILESFEKHKTEENKYLEINLKTHLKQVNTNTNNVDNALLS